MFKHGKKKNLLAVLKQAPDEHAKNMDDLKESGDSDDAMQGFQTVAAGIAETSL